MYELEYPDELDVLHPGGECMGRGHVKGSLSKAAQRQLEELERASSGQRLNGFSRATGRYHCPCGDSCKKPAAFHKHQRNCKASGKTAEQVAEKRASQQR